jgi:hypothetical protein
MSALGLVAVAVGRPGADAARRRLQQPHDTVRPKAGKQNLLPDRESHSNQAGGVLHRFAKEKRVHILISDVSMTFQYEATQQHVTMDSRDPPAQTRVPFEKSLEK